jgi:hypothetical protein
VAIWDIFGYFVYFSRFGMLYQEKSGNPGHNLPASKLFLAQKLLSPSFSVTRNGLGKRQKNNRIIEPLWGRFFVHFFPPKITFRGKFRGITWKNDFSKLFPRKIQFFPNIFWGKFSAKFSAEKMYEKSSPGEKRLARNRKYIVCNLFGQNLR